MQAIRYNSTEQDTYTLGIQETESGSAQTTLDTLEEILDDLTSTAAARKGETGKIILSKIKSTMSDRAATEKAFSDSLSQYHSEILPTVLQGWEELSNEEHQSMSRMHNFYCGMHFVTNMASEAMRLFDKAYSDEVVSSLVSTSEDTTEFLTGETVPFPGISIKCGLHLLLHLPWMTLSSRYYRQYSNHWNYYSQEDACIPSPWR